MFLKPAPGLIVPNPVTGKPLAPAGEEVAESSYWIRRLSGGDVVKVEVTPEFVDAVQEEIVKTLESAAE